MAKSNKIKTRIFYFLLFLSGVAIFLPGRFTDKLNFMASGITNLFSGKPHALAAEVNDSISEIVDASDPESELKKQYQSALIELNNVKSEIEYQRQFIRELANIRTDLSLGRAILVRSHIAADDSSVTRKCKILDRGSNDYIRPGLIALAGCPDSFTPGDPQNAVNEITWKSAVAGRVIEARPDSSVVQMVNDQAFSANVVIKPAFNRGEVTGTDGVLHNDGSGMIHIKHVETSSEVLPGDPVFLKASEHTLPVDVIIGYVAECSYDPDNAVLWNITVRPAIDLTDVKDVVVICRENER